MLFFELLISVFICILLICESAFLPHALIMLLFKALSSLTICQQVGQCPSLSQFRPGHTDQSFPKQWNAGTASILLSSTKNRLLPESINASYILSRQKSTLLQMALQMADCFYPARIFGLCPPRIHLCPIRLIRNLFKYPLIPESGGKPRQIGCPDCR